jgi:signal transduction histidine kinase
MLALRAGIALETARLYETEALQAAWLQNVIDQIPEGLVLVDAAGKTTSNRSLRAMLGGESLRVEELALARAYQRGETVRDVAREALRPDGARVSLLIHAAPVYASDGKVIGASAIVQDVTARKELERLREEWSSVIAHDLRQPVTVVGLGARAIAAAHEGPLSPREAEALGRISRAADRLDRMIRDLVDASRLEAHRMTLERRAVPLAGLVREVLDRHQDVLGDQPVRVVASADPAVWVDPDRVEQVLVNLLANAVRYGEPGAEIRVDVEAVGDEAEIAVTNRGRGIAAEELPRLFERSARGEEGARRRKEGLGLGLYICKGLVEAHGGRIWAESVPGDTTTFHVRLPRAPERRDEAPPAELPY